MLSELHIKNFALADDITIDFSGELIVLTGETGAGKSILIDAIRFVLGERLDSVRLGRAEKPTSVQAAFELQRTSENLQEYLEEGESLIILRREVNQSRSRCWINDRMVTQTVLKQVGSELVDIHGQYDHQLLLDTQTQLEIVDRYAKSDPLIEKYRTVYSDYTQLLGRKKELEALEETRERELDLLKYQVEEIGGAELDPDEEEQIQTERTRLANAEKLFEITRKILEALDENDHSASSLLLDSARQLQSLVRLDESMEETQNQFEDAQLSLEEVIRSIRDYQESLSFEPDRLSELESRIDQINLLKKKYGESITKVLEFYEEASKKYDDLLNSKHYEMETEQAIEKLIPELKKLSDQISAQRKKAAEKIAKSVESELKDLQMMHSKFSCDFQEVDFGPKGKDQMEFMVQINPGRGMESLRKVVSAGEISRLMLALKKTLAKVDRVETLIFDEIDSNIGGRLGTVTGKKLRGIADERQVLLITHLPQIASFADKHIKVTKVVRKGETYTDYQMIEGSDRVEELSQMMSGQEGSDISKQHAQEMLERVK